MESPVAESTFVHEYTELPARVPALLQAALERGAAIDGPGRFANVAPRPADEDGDRESVGSTEAVHHFVDTPGDSATVRWHYVEAGEGEAVVFLHGIPESWFMWHRQIDALASSHRAIAIDLKGYGQSEKGTGDYRQEGVAEQLAMMLDRIGVDRFHIVSHDRGSVVADYLGAAHPERVLSYTRGEQHLYHLNPALHPQELLFTDPDKVRIMAKPAQFTRMIYALVAKNQPSDADLERTIQEFSYPGTDWAVPRYFNSSSFRKEWIDRRERLMAAWTFPVMILEGYDDPFQPREFYLDAGNWIDDVEVKFVGAGHFYHFENPAETTAAIVDFVRRHSKRASSTDRVS
jgi:pimeloyl-ACP methyl ester carboxylesterase